MFTQFRVRYPQGSLITELLGIDHGKYIVRALVQVEGVTLATGLAAADTVELAEDHARNRALTVLDISPTTSIGEKETRNSVAELPVSPHLSPIPETTLSQESLGQVNQSPLFPETSVPKFDAASLSFSEPKRPDISLAASPVAWEPDAIPFADEFSPAEVEMPTIGNVPEFETPVVMSPKMPESQFNPPAVTPVSGYQPNQPQSSPTGMPVTAEPFDVSEILSRNEILNRTEIELKRLDWSVQKGRDYLVATYNKRSRTLLTDEELLEFLHFLASQPTPND